MSITSVKPDLNRFLLNCRFRSEDKIIVDWNGKPSIFAKFDWFTCIFNNTCILDILNCIGLGDLATEDLNTFFRSFFILSTGASTPDLAFSFNGVLLQINTYNVYKELDIDDVNELTLAEPLWVFKTRFDRIRLDISGSGLDYLRKAGIDVDNILFTPFELPCDVDGEPAQYHVTRCDAAFDLIDYAPDFLNNCKTSCFQLSDPRTGRISVSKGAVKWSTRDGDQNTLYLGSTGSDRLLRIYDKKLQFTQKNKYVSDCPYRNGEQLPDSWIRIELQCRRNDAGVILYDCHNFSHILRYLFDRFAMRSIKYEYSYERKPGDILPFWNELFDFEKIPAIVRNLHFVQSQSILETAVDFIFGPACSNELVVIGNFGWQQYKDTFDKEFKRIQTSDLPSDIARKNRILNKLLCSCDGYLPPFIDVDKNGLYFIKE